MQSTEPRPEGYFLFLFELLRIFKTPAELILATIIHTFNYDRELYIPVDDVVRTEDARTRLLAAHV